MDTNSLKNHRSSINCFKNKHQRKQRSTIRRSQYLINYGVKSNDKLTGNDSWEWALRNQTQRKNR